MWLVLVPIVALPLAYFFWIFTLYTRPPVVGASVVTHFEPPADVSPAEAAFLLDGTIKPRAVVALLVDLHLDGRLRIEERDGAISGYRRHNDGAMRPEETIAMSILFQGDQEVGAAEAAARFAAYMKILEDEIRDGLRQRGYLASFPMPPIILFIAAVGASLILYLSVIVRIGFIAAAAAFVVTVLMLQFAYVAATWRPALTPKGKAALLHLLGFKVWLMQVESDSIVWQERVEGRTHELTPYAIAFGAPMAWATKLQKLTAELLDNIL